MKPQMSPCRSSAEALWSTSTSVVLHANAISLAATVKNPAEDNVSSDQFRLQFFNSIHCDHVCVGGGCSDGSSLHSDASVPQIYIYT